MIKYRLSYSPRVTIDYEGYQPFNSCSPQLNLILTCISHHEVCWPSVTILTSTLSELNADDVGEIKAISRAEATNRAHV